VEDTIIFKSVPAAVKSLRKNELGLTQRRFAALLGKTVTAIANWEQGIYRPPPDTLLRLAALARDEELAQYFKAEAVAETASAKHPRIPRRAKPRGDPVVERYRYTIATAAGELSKHANRGDGAARELLKHFADELIERVGQGVAKLSKSVKGGKLK